MSNDVAIVIPGGPRNSADRVAVALKSYGYLKSKGYDVHLIATGMHLHDSIKKSLRRYGISENDIIIEPYAKSTEDNVVNSVKICEDNAWRNVLFTTSYYQAKRMAKEIREHVPEDWNVGCDYVRPELVNPKYDAFLFGRYLHELGAVVKDIIGNSKSSTSRKVSDTMLELEGKIFNKIGFG